MLGNNGYLFVKCNTPYRLDTEWAFFDCSKGTECALCAQSVKGIYMQQVTKGHLYHLLGVSDYYVMYRHRPQSVL